MSGPIVLRLQGQESARRVWLDVRALPPRPRTVFRDRNGARALAHVVRGLRRADVPHENTSRPGHGAGVPRALPPGLPLPARVAPLPADALDARARAVDAMSGRGLGGGDEQPPDPPDQVSGAAARNHPSARTGGQDDVS